MKRISTIGEGGFGRVSLYESGQGEFVAVKEMLTEWKQEDFNRVGDQLEKVQGLNYPNFVKTEKFEWEGGRGSYTMPYFAEGSLRELMLNLQSNRQWISRSGVIGLGLHLAEALSFAHERGMVHRNLKPENILLSGTRPMISDWGSGLFLFKESPVLVHCGGRVRTYCSPEQWNHGKSDAQGDIFSLGKILHELLTGSLNRDVSKGPLGNLIHKMTARNISHRIRSMGEVVANLEKISGFAQIENWAEGVLEPLPSTSA